MNKVLSTIREHWTAHDDEKKADTRSWRNAHQCCVRKEDGWSHSVLPSPERRIPAAGGAGRQGRAAPGLLYRRCPPWGFILCPLQGWRSEFFVCPESE